MKNSIKIWLSDMQQAMKEIDCFITGIESDEDFKSDLKTKRAIERNIGIIGEALNRILKQEPDIKISNSRKIVDTRNRIIHGYDTVSEDVIWTIVQKDLPKLKIEVENLLD